MQSDWWLSLYIATLVLVLVYRVLLPTLRFLRLDLRVSGVEPAGPDITSITVDGTRRSTASMRAAGQFMIWRFLCKGLWWQSHPFSLSAAPDGRSLRITVKAVGGYTRKLAGTCRSARACLLKVRSDASSRVATCIGA